MSHKRALIMAGGTGGHVFPALATARSLQARDVDIHWMGTQRGIESTVVPNADIPLHTIDIQGVRGKGKLGLLLAPFRLFKAITQALTIVRKIQPDVVLGMGGFASGPGAVAAKLLGIPLVIHEQNAVAGTTNKISSKLATRVLEAFSGAFKGKAKTEETGNPVRGDILKLDSPEQRYALRAQTNSPINLLVIGGSLGAKAINEMIPEALALLGDNERPNVWHQTGKAHLEMTQGIYQALGLTDTNTESAPRVVPFIEKMDEAYAWADMVVCRSGALTVSELAIAGVPALLVPFPFAIDDHQTANAGYLEKAGAGWLIQQKDLTPEKIASLIKENSDRDVLLQKAIKARTVAKPEASERVAQVCLEVMK